VRSPIWVGTFCFSKRLSGFEEECLRNDSKVVYAGELHTSMWPIATLESRKTALVGLFQNPNLGAVNNVRPS
jgi:hypothetical protein